MSEDDIDPIGADAAGVIPRLDRDRRAPRFSWTPSYEATFFQSLCESVSLGLRENSSFKAEAWERAANALQATHGAYPTKSHLINKSDNARKRFRLWRGLREDPEFVYNHVTKTVSATEEAWRAHIEREPLSRALRGRPFDHEDYMEILYPDVVGSGGAPKRIMKPRRRLDGAPLDEADMPGTGILNLQGTHHHLMMDPSDPRSLLNQTPSSSNSSLPPLQPLMPVASTNSLSTASSTALTPPDDALAQGQSRKRGQQLANSAPTSTSTASAQPANSIVSPPTTMAAPVQSANSPHKRRRTSPPGPSSVAGASTLSMNPSVSQAQAQAQSQSGEPTTVAGLLQLPLLEEVLETLKTRAAPPRWREQALDIFFSEFSGEELDLQVKISENVLSNNENKAMVFCKMPPVVRQHWVGKFREMHQLNKTA